MSYINKSGRTVRTYYGQMKNLPTLTNFDDAYNMWNQIKPLRGRETRPLGNRNHKYYTIECWADGQTKHGVFKQTKTVACFLYGDPVLTFSDNGDIELRVYDGDWGPRSRARFCDFVSHILDVEAQVGKRKVHICFDGETNVLVPHEGDPDKLIVRGSWEKLSLPEVERGSYAQHMRQYYDCKGEWSNIKIRSAASTKVLRVNRKVARKVRSIVKPFSDYCVNMAKLVVDGGSLIQEDLRKEKHPLEASQHPFKKRQLNLQELKIVFTEEREMLMPYVFAAAAVYVWNGDKYTLTEEDIRTEVLDLCKHMHKDYFQEVDSPEGKLVRDPYRVYWSSTESGHPDSGGDQ